MAKVELNDGIKRIRGKIDGWVYRNLNGQVVAHAYREPDKDAPSTAQLNQRERFRAAQAYAADVLADPLRRRVYQSRSPFGDVEGRGTSSQKLTVERSKSRGVEEPDAASSVERPESALSIAKEPVNRQPEPRQ